MYDLFYCRNFDGKFLCDRQGDCKQVEKTDSLEEQILDLIEQQEEL